jgi:hypothetical protein
VVCFRLTAGDAIVDGRAVQVLERSRIAAGRILDQPLGVHKCFLMGGA